MLGAGAPTCNIDAFVFRIFSYSEEYKRISAAAFVMIGISCGQEMYRRYQDVQDKSWYWSANKVITPYIINHGSHTVIYTEYIYI